MLLVEPDIRTRVDELARANGTTHSIEGARYLRLGLEYEARRGGPRTMHLLQACAEIALGMYAHEDEWIDDPAKYPEVIGTWYQVLIEHAPPTWKATLDQKISAGRDLITELLTTRDSRRADHLRNLLRAFSKSEQFPLQVRQEFAGAADCDAFLLPQQSEQPPPPLVPPPDWRATPAVISAMRTAQVMLGRPSAGEPDDDTIALVLTDAGLRRQGDVPESVRTLEQFKRWRAELTNAPPVAEPEPWESVLGLPEAVPEAEVTPAPAAEVERVRQMIERTRRHIAALDGALKNLVAIYAEDGSLPAEAREEFSRAAAEEPPQNQQQDQTTAGLGGPDKAGSA